MSRPTPNYFCVHTGFFRNDRTLALTERIGDRAFYVPQMLWSFAGENQMDGDLSHLSTKQFRKIFAGCHLALTEHETVKVIDALREVGFIQKGRLHSWEKFNRQFVYFEKRQNIKRQAAFKRWKLKVEDPPSEGPAPSNGPSKGPAPSTATASQEVWLIDQQLKDATGKEKKDLLRRRRETLQRGTGIAKDPPRPPAPAPTLPAEHDPKKFQRVLLENARLLLKQEHWEVITEGMIRALHQAGDELPVQVKAKYRKLLAELEEKSNPVPA